MFDFTDYLSFLVLKWILTIFNSLFSEEEAVLQKHPKVFDEVVKKNKRRKTTEMRKQEIEDSPTVLGTVLSLSFWSQKISSQKFKNFHEKYFIYFWWQIFTNQCHIFGIIAIEIRILVHKYSKFPKPKARTISSCTLQLQVRNR